MTNEEYIAAHREDDVRRLALSRVPEGVDARWCLQQIEGWQAARRKLPSWAATEGIWYPPRLAMEQCSSEATARYKRRVAGRLIPEAERLSMADLTGGLGVDFASLGTLFREATYCELQPQLVELARHNMPILFRGEGQEVGGKGQEVGGKRYVLNTVGAYPCVCPRKQEIPTEGHTQGYAPAEEETSLLFLDPSRRDGVGRKTVAIQDCTPNLLEMQDQLLARCRWLMVKFSPMLDIAEALRQLHNVREVHVVSVRGECKELLFVMEGEGQRAKGEGQRTLAGAKRLPFSPLPFAFSPLPLTYHCVNLESDDDEVIMRISDNEKMRDHGMDVSHSLNLSFSQFLNLSFSQFLYEPNASVLKAGVQDVLCERYGVRKLHPRSHLFVGDEAIPHFPGRCFRITGWSDFGKKNLKALIGDLRQANLTVRNFPVSVDRLRRQLHLAEGGDAYLFATTVADGRHVLIRCQRHFFTN